MKHEDVAGFCKSAALEEIRKHGHVLTSGHYVGAEAIEDEGVPFEKKTAELSARLYEQMHESVDLDEGIRKNLEYPGFGR